MTVALLVVWRWLRCTSEWKKRIRLLDGRRAEDGCAAKCERGHRGIRCFVCGREVDDGCAGVGGGREVDYC